MTDDGSRKIADDVAEGLGLLLRAARRAIQKVDKTTIDRVASEVSETVGDLGKKAAEAAGRVDTEQLKEAGKKAAEVLDPRRVEDFAEEAGKELLNVVQKVAGRVEGVLRDVEATASRDPGEPRAPDPPADPPRPASPGGTPPKNGNGAPN